MRYAALALGALLLLGAGPALAGEPAPAVAEARRYNAEAEKLFALGMFQQAAEAYHKAYLARPIPAFLYNIGQCYWRAGGEPDLRKALLHYESFRNATDDPEQRRGVEQKIAEVRAAIDRLEAERRRPPPIYKRWWFWTLTGVAVAAVTTGLVLGLRGEDQKPIEGSATPPVLRFP